MGKAFKCRINGAHGDNAGFPCSECQNPEQCQTRRKQVVIVDDDHDLLDELSEFLVSCGLKTHAHTSPYQAMSFIETHDFDVLLADIEMPGITGLQLADWVHESRPEIAVILISGINMNSKNLRGGWLFFRKPVDFAELQQVIHSIE